MKKKFEYFINILLNSLGGLLNLKRRSKIIFLLVIDYLIILSSIILVNFFLGFDNQYFLINQLNIYQLLFVVLISISTFIFSGQYNSLSRYIRSSEIYSIGKRNLFLIPVLIFSELVFKGNLSYLKFYFLFWVITSFIISLSRFGLKEASNFYELSKYKGINKVAIYGAGAAGAQLASAIKLVGNHKIEAFLDDSSSLIGRELLGVPIFASNEISKLKGKIDQILLAIPSLDKSDSIKLIKRVQSFEIPILKVPSVEELTSGNAKIDSLRPIEIEDLLGRIVVQPNQELLSSAINKKNICITGAGGSIGKELCNQVLRNSPKSLVMIDSSETNLYNLEQEVVKSYLVSNEGSLRLILGNVRDHLFLRDIFQKNSIDIVIHAAAYKHVPLIEKNPLKGIENNVFSTYSVCKAAEDSKVKKVLLISTDKAVRPSNVMGASKRLSELVIQAFADKNKSKINNDKNQFPIFSLVRFGNVLNSSGSVVPLFKKQIANGGPLTLTHKEIIRFFMTVPEAAQLVIQASTLSEGGEVFLLDMGEPIKIIDLAKQMIRLSGYSIKNKDNPNGDIEIITTGLRPGEKLYEELLIDAESKSTKHPLIFKANEAFISFDKLTKDLKKLENFLKEQNQKESLLLLSKLVPEWKKSLEIF